ncbi:unnamed protein product [Brassica oleracea var. botrytis]
MTTNQTEGCLGEKLDGVQAGLKGVLDRILKQTEMVAATHVEVTQETPTDFVVIPIKRSHCFIKKVDEFKDQETEFQDLDTEGEVVIFKFQSQVSEKQQPKLDCANQHILTDTPPHLDSDEDEDDFIVFEGRALK